MEYAISLERAHNKDRRTTNIYVENPLRTCRSIPCQTLSDSTIWNKGTVDDDSVLQNRPSSTSMVRPQGAVHLSPACPPGALPPMNNHCGCISPVQANGYNSMQLICGGPKYSPDLAHPENLPRSRSPTPNDSFRALTQCHQSSRPQTPLPRTTQGLDNHHQTVLNDTDRKTQPECPVCPRCSQPRDKARETDDEDRTTGYDQNRIIDAVSCLCCVKAVFYHCCSDEDDDSHCADSPCSCAGRPLCCPRWACLVLAGATCLPCLILYWPIRVLVRLFAGCRRALVEGSEHRCDCKRSSKNRDGSGKF